MARIMLYFILRDINKTTERGMIMKIHLIGSMILGMLAMGVSATAYSVPVTDVQDFSNNISTEFFVDNDANKYSSPYYRSKSQDWGWTHNAIAGTSFTSIVLNISAFDVDYCAASYCEHDMISIYDGSSWLNLGDLAGANNAWAFTEFDLTSYSWAEAQVNAGLQVFMDIDATNTGSWLVTLGKSTLSVDGGSQACVPTPGVPCTPTVPEPSTGLLLGIGLLGFGMARRKMLSSNR